MNKENRYDKPRLTRRGAFVAGAGATILALVGSYEAKAAIQSVTHEEPKIPGPCATDSLEPGEGAIAPMKRAIAKTGADPTDIKGVIPDGQSLHGQLEERGLAIPGTLIEVCMTDDLKEIATFKIPDHS